MGIELVEDDARLDAHGAALGIEGEHAIEVAADVDDERLADGLPALRRAAAARQDGHAGLRREVQDRRHIVQAFRANDAQRHDLVDRRVRGVAPPAEGIKHHLALQGRFQAALQTWA